MSLTCGSSGLSMRKTWKLPSPRREERKGRGGKKWEKEKEGNKRKGEDRNEISKQKNVIIKH